METPFKRRTASGNMVTAAVLAVPLFLVVHFGVFVLLEGAPPWYVVVIGVNVLLLLFAVTSG